MDAGKIGLKNGAQAADKGQGYLSHGHRLLGSIENGSVGKSVCLASISLVSHTHGKRWACYFSTGEAGRPANLD